MNDSIKEQIYPIYSELQGYLSQAPLVGEAYYIYESPIWEQLHSVIEELNEMTDENYDKFRLTIIQDGSGPHIITHEYRSKLNGLIMHLYGKYFREQPTPFSGSPATIINQSQTQQQSQVIMILEIQDFLNKKLYTERLDEKEKTFLEKIKSTLPTIKNSVELINLIFTTAKSLGLDINQVTKIFG